MMCKRFLGLIIISMLIPTAGCSVFDMGQYDSFESWYTGKPYEDYDDLGAEDTPQFLRMLYGPVWAVPYGIRDLTRHALVPVALIYHGTSTQIKRPAPSEKPAPAGTPADVPQ